MASAEVRQIRRRIKSVQATMKITRAFELIAASRIVRSSRGSGESLPYIHAHRGDSQRRCSRRQLQPILLEQREVRTGRSITSDRGLAGAYNTNVLRLVPAARAAARGDRNTVSTWWEEGTGGTGRGYHVRRAFLGVTDRPGYGDARAVANHILDEYASGEIDQLDVVYNRFQSALTQVTSESRAPGQAAGGPGRPPPPVSYEFDHPRGNPRPYPAALRRGRCVRDAARGFGLGMLPGSGR